MKLKLFMVSIIILLFLIPNTSAQSTSFLSSLTPNACKSAYSATNPVHNYSSFSNLMVLSLIIMTIMLFVSGILWAIGGVLNFPKLKIYSKSEIGEVFLTVLIIVIILGTFAVTSSTLNKGVPLISSVFNETTYTHDCNTLYTGVSSGVTYAIGLVVYQDVLKAFGSLSLTIEPTWFGYGYSPLSGLSYVSNLMGLLVTVSMAITGLSFGGIIILDVVYTIAPLFFFVGIILRTLPWTKAAGGSFLGVFIGFYIIFPTLFFIFASGAASISPIANSSIPTSLYPTSLPSALSGSFINSETKAVANGSGMIDEVIVGLIAPMLYLLISLVISLIVAFDFIDTLGDLLGSPSLSSGGSFRNLI